MGFDCGIVGLPNVGKSTLFNALTRTGQAQAANYPFCTIEPNIGEIDVPDPRLETLAQMAGSERIVPARMRFVDIAGLVRGAAGGEGLGNRFLAHIRSVDAIVHVLRCFEDPDIAHVEGRVDPIADREAIETELMLADLDSLARRLPALEKRAKGGDELAHRTLDLCARATRSLEQGRPARMVEIAPEELAVWRSLDLLTTKPVLVVANVGEAEASTGNALSDGIGGAITISAAIEAELASLSPSDRKEYLAAMGLESSGLDRLTRAGYALLGLITFFTAGPKEARAWTVSAGTDAARAAGRIHGDFERGFICAEVIPFADFVSCGGEQAARAAGRMRQEGREYPVGDGDVMHFRFNV